MEFGADKDLQKESGTMLSEEVVSFYKYALQQRIVMINFYIILKTLARRRVIDVPISLW